MMSQLLIGNTNINFFGENKMNLLQTLFDGLLSSVSAGMNAREEMI